MSLEIIKQNAMAIQEASSVYAELLKTNKDISKLRRVRQYILKLAYHIQQRIDEEKNHVTGS